MKIKEAIEQASLILQNVTQRPKYEAEILLSFLLQKDRVFLHTNNSLDINETKYFDLVDRRKNFEPIEYITNSVSFYSEEFFIDYGALIPRPETELLIDHTLSHLKPNDKVVEIGVGSGIISIMLAKMFENATYFAGDISQDAIKIAKINIDNFGLNDKIELFCSSLLDDFDKQVDVIVSNPPYIQDGFVLEKPLSFEPQNALFGGMIGDEILKSIIDLAYIKNVRLVCCEMGFDQKEKIQQYIDTKNYKYKELFFYKDLANIDRGFILSIK